uniref:Uncharacterized protein n=1 Tax=viral metagenome TaxID=1070528 RepID=A0A6C0AEE5_9ZZZZ
MRIPLINNLYKKFNNSCLKNVHCWQVKINNEFFLILPAHVSLFIKKDTWMRSSFLDSVSHLNWQIPSKYIKTLGMEYDLAWAKYYDPNYDYIKLKECKIPSKVNAYFRTNLKYDGTYTNITTFGSKEITIYESPGFKNKELLESLDLGYRGMSGSIIANKNHMVGMFVGSGNKPTNTNKLMNSNFVYNQEKYISEKYISREELQEILVLERRKRGLILPSKRIIELIRGNNIALIDIHMKHTLF